MKRILTLCGLFLLVGGMALTAQDYDRVTLVEDFSSVTCVNCPQASAIVNAIVEENKGKVVAIQYHLDIPGRNDPFYAQNKPHQDARETYYGGFNALPQVFVDGISVAGTNEAEVRGEVSGQQSSKSPVQVKVTQTMEGGSIKVEVTVEGADNLVSGNRLYAVAVEKYVERTREYFTDTAKSRSYYNETEFHDLFRTFASPVNGEELSGDATQMFSYTVPMGERWEPTEMYVIAWVQDEFNLEVAQAGFSTPSKNSVGRENRVEGYEILSVSPNPASDDVTVSLRIAERENVTVGLYNALGQKVRTVEKGIIEAGDHTVGLETGELPNGTYHLRVEAGVYTATRALQIVR